MILCNDATDSTFLTEHLVGYNRKVRRLIGTSEKN